MQDLTPVEVIEVGNVLGEGVLWDDRLQAAWWSDIEGRRLYRFDLGTRRLREWRTPVRLCSFGLTHEDGFLLAAFEDGFAWYAPESGALEWIARPRFARREMRLNDGRVDRQGRFWAGAMHELGSGFEEPVAALYCLDAHGRLSEHEHGIAISNSLCWSPDGRTMYLADSVTPEIRAYDFDPRAGTLSRRRRFAKVRDPGIADGSAVDARGRLWNAQWGGGRVVRFEPDGTESLVLRVPAAQPTCVAFGGPGLTHLFVSSATLSIPPAELAGRPNEGHLFVFETQDAGLPEPRYAGRR